eukprot:5054309-Prymnesium_polylepis.2
MASCHAQVSSQHAGAAGGGPGGDGGRQRSPQSVQLVPVAQGVNSLPAPPSSHCPSKLWMHVSEQQVGGAGGGGGSAGEVSGGDGGDCGGGEGQRLPQSVQSVPHLHMSYSLPGPPSSQPPSDADQHKSPQQTGDEGG